MLSETQMARYADVLIWGLSTARIKPFEKGDVILIRYHRPAMALAEILHKRFLEMGMNPVHRILSTPFMERNLFRIGDDAQVSFLPPGEKELFFRLNGSVMLNAPESITHLSDVSAEKISRSILSQKVLRDILQKRESIGELGWTLCIYPTQALADCAGISLEEYVAQVVNACFLDNDSPKEKWKEIHRRAGKIKKWLGQLPVDKIHVESENIDLKIRLGQSRKWIGISGRNIPSFEIFVSPDWRGTQGKFYADQPSYRNGNLVRGATFEFENGKLVRADAKEGGDFLLKQLETDAGARRVGEFSLTDRRFSKIDRFMANTLFDENFGGTHGNCHLALGNSYENTFSGDSSSLTEQTKKDLGFNESAIHWDFVNTEQKRVAAILSDGKRQTIYENGRFALEDSF